MPTLTHVDRVALAPRVRVRVRVRARVRVRVRVPLVPALSHVPE